MGMAMHALTVISVCVRVTVRSPCPPDSALRRRASREPAAARGATGREAEAAEVSGNCSRLGTCVERYVDGSQMAAHSIGLHEGVAGCFVQQPFVHAHGAQLRLASAPALARKSAARERPQSASP